MILTEVAPVAAAALPVALLRDHLRMGSGFADDAVQDGLLEAYLRAALAAIEGRTGKALLARDFRLVLSAWRSAEGQDLPVAPVTAVASVTLRDAGGAATVVPAAAYRLERDMHCPRLAAAGGWLPAVPAGGTAEVMFTGGFGVWASLPPDLAQSVLLLAAHYHENRHAAGDGPAAMPFGVMALIERWRTIRITGGGA